MINVLATKLPSITDKNNMLWKNNKINLYDKFSQNTIYQNATSPHFQLKEVNEVKEVKEVKEVNEVNEVNEVKEVNEIKNKLKPLIKVPKVLNVKPVKNGGLSDILIIPQIEKKNIKKPNPIDIILEKSLTCHIYKSDVKEKLITFISSNEFSKVFGITKSSEIMSGIVNERFNKSVALFLSFLLDKKIIYNEKEIIYNKNKENSDVIII